MIYGPEHICEFILERGEFKGLECAKPTVWSLSNPHRYLCKKHIEIVRKRLANLGGKVE